MDPTYSDQRPDPCPDDDPGQEPDDTTEFEVEGEALATAQDKGSETGEAVIDGWTNDGEVIDTLQDLVAGECAPTGEKMVALMDEFSDGTSAADQQDEIAAEIAAAHERKVADNMARVIYLGSSAVPRSFSIFAFDERNTPLAVSHDGGNVIMAMGAQGYGKTVSAMLKIEAAIQDLIGICSPFRYRTGAFSFFVDPGGTKFPQALAGINPNGNARDLDFLLDRLGAQGTPLPCLNLVVPTWLMDYYHEHLHRHLGARLRLKPLLAGLPQLGQASLEALLGAGDDAQYVQFMLQEAQDLGDQLTMAAWHEIIDRTVEMNSTSKARAHRRLRLLDRITCKGGDLWDLGGPDELTVFCLGGRWIGWRDALPVIVALINGLVQRSPKHGPFQRLFHIDEVNHLDGDPVVCQQLLMLARLIRHLGSTLWISGQDFKRMPTELLALSTIFMMFRVMSPEIFLNVKQRRTGYEEWGYESVGELGSGVALTAASESTDPLWRGGAQKTFFRPMCCQHGGDTKSEY